LREAGGAEQSAVDPIELGRCRDAQHPGTRPGCHKFPDPAEPYEAIRGHTTQKANSNVTTRHSTTPRSKVNPKTSAELETYINGFIPSHTTALQAWPTIQGFCRDIAIRMHPSTINVAHRLLWTVAPFVAWTRSVGIQLDVEHVFTPDNVERYCALIVDGTIGTQRTVRDTLRRIGPRVTRKAPWPPKPRSYGRTPVAKPYNQVEIRRLIETATHQPTRDRRDLYRALLGFGLGCGIDGRGVLLIGPDDIATDLFGIDITTGDPRRAVACLHQYAPLLADAVALLDRRPTNRLFASDRTLSKFLETSAAKDGTRLKLARLRSTWLLQHLTIGTPLTVLLDAAGLKTPSMLNDLLGMVPPICPKRSSDLLRGANR
jgi:hypothetical protein